jgi:N-acetyl-anhydromuramyl-L-alanine amidase AmpD
VRIIEHGWRWAGSLTRRWGAPRYLIFHHADAVASPEQVHRAHLAKGWKGIGYHYYVRKSGTVHRGRPEWAVGAHTKGHNRELGVCCEGHFTRERMSAVQLAALKALRYDVHGRYLVADRRHSDFCRTVCPGTYFPWAAVISNEVLRMGAAGPAVKMLQQALRAKGYRLAVDGSFGPLTRTAVLAFQRRGRLAADGVVGPMTWHALGY